jgi:hypothetical protein
LHFAFFIAGLYGCNFTALDMKNMMSTEAIAREEISYTSFIYIDV